MYKIRRAYLVTTKGYDGHENSVIISPCNGSFIMKRSESDNFGREGGVFFCIFVLMMTQIVMLGSILAWKFFNLDIFPDYNGNSNVQTDYNDYHEKHHMHD